MIMFCDRLRKLRKSSGYKSQQAFADAFGVAQSTVGSWEAGEREPNFNTAIRLARFFGVSIGCLLDEEAPDQVFVPDNGCETDLTEVEQRCELAEAIRCAYLLSDIACVIESGEYTYKEVMQVLDRLRNHYGKQGRNLLDSVSIQKVAAFESGGERNV